MRQLALTLLFVFLFVGPLHAQDAAQCSWEWEIGHWKYTNDSGEAASVIWKLASDGRAIIGHWRNDDGTTATEVAGWRPNEGTLVSTSYGSDGSCGELVCTKVTDKMLQGKMTRREADGSVSQGNWRMTKHDENTMATLLERTIDDKQETIRGTFRRVVSQEDAPTTAERLTVMQELEGEWIAQVTAKEDWEDGTVKAGDVFDEKLKYTWLNGKTGMLLEIGAKAKGAVDRTILTGLIGWDAASEQIVTNGIFWRGALLKTIMEKGDGRRILHRQIASRSGALITETMIVTHIDENTITTQIVERDGQQQKGDIVTWKRTK